ncbi:rhomboid protease ROM8, putative [Plasmodium ovale]|uniref:Rhomboid-like protease n=1 Tax=Plasmodium ovale TaxID=36330 RepID=A0A1C3KXU1_PLAOA|nr:rhomboid protease ROM8, putative [Plasmodium ovale]
MDQKKSGTNTRTFLESKDKREKIDEDDDEDDKKERNNDNHGENNTANDRSKKNEKKKNKFPENSNAKGNDEKNDKTNKRNEKGYVEVFGEKKKEGENIYIENEKGEEEENNHYDRGKDNVNKEERRGMRETRKIVDSDVSNEKEDNEYDSKELLNLSSNNTVKFFKIVNDKKNIIKDVHISSKKERHKSNNASKEKKLKMNSAYEDLLSDHHDYTSLKVNYKINKKSNYEKTKKRPFMSISINEKQERTVNRSSICTDNAKFLNFLNDNEKNAHYYKNRKRLSTTRRRQQIKTNIKKKEKNDMKDTSNNCVLNISEKNKHTEIFPSEVVAKAKTSLKHHPRSEKKEKAYVKEIKEDEDKQKMKDIERLKNYATTVEEEKKIVKEKSKIKSFPFLNRRYFIFRKKTLRKRKEKIIIFLNHNYLPCENGQFNDHFYRTVHKNDLENLEEEKIYIDNNKENTIKKIIYRIFPQFSIFSLILYVTFIQWVIFILLISVKSDLTLTPSNDSLKNFGSNFPHNIYTKAEFYRLFTALFLHSNFNHICANTYVQLTVGFLLEYLYGTYVVFLVYVFTGIYGIILSSPLTYCYSTTESSSSSSGIIGIFFSEILMMTNFNVDKISISVHLFCFFLLLLFLKFSLNTGSINIYSHFFGFLGGFLIGIILKRNQLKYFLRNNLLIQILSLIFLIISLAAAIFISTYVVQKCPN